MMNRFFLMTRGRTGSTAIIDEINNVKAVFAAQELFIKRDFKNLMKQNLMAHYQSIIPFELWKMQGSLWQKVRRRFLGDRELVANYLLQIESKTRRKGVAAFGFKALSHHFDETPFLKETLIDQGFRVIYLTRNIPRQVISGMIAKQRGVYNRKNYQDDARYQIDVDEFETLVKLEATAVHDDLSFIKNCGFDLIQVSYEDFMGDRSFFFTRVLEFLEVAVELPEKSDYSVMIKDLRHTVENFNTVRERASAMGMPIE